MRAIVYDLSIPKYVAAKAFGRLVPALYDGAPSCISLRDDVPEPALPGDDWVMLRPILAGICGSDLGFVYFKSAPSLSAYGSHPFVPGHEVLAVVAHTGPGVTEVKEGDRVVVDPWLHCEVRGHAPCTPCERGDYQLCEHSGVQPMKGMTIGACADLPGGWGERMVAHRSQLFGLPDSITDDRGVLAEPLAVGVHSVLRHPPRAGDRVLIVGGGPIAYSVLFALRELIPDVDVTLSTHEREQADFAEQLGADRAWVPDGQPLVERAAQLTGARVLKPDVGPRFLAGGFEVVYDCVGSSSSVRDAMHLVRGGGRLVMVGAAGVLPALDLTHLWTKEIRVEGTLAYGYDEWRNERRRTFAITRELLEGSERPIERLVTHRYPLEDYRTALQANLHRSRTGALKTVLLP